MITGRKPTDFTPLNSLVGDEKFYTQSLTDSFQSTLPAIGDYMETYINGDKTQQQGTYLVSGGRVVWVEDLKFTVTAAVYLINGIRYTSEEQEVTLTTADPTNPRIDTFYLDVNSQFGAIAGTPAATPAEPSINPETQIRLTIATINAGATTPAGISNEIIYNENLGVAGGEWDTSVNILGYSTFEDTADPAKDSKSIKTSVFEINTLTLRFTNNANINLSDYDSLVLRVRQRGRAASNQGITLYWSDTIGASYSWNPSVLLRPGTFGFTTPNEEWQTIVIPIASFNPYEANRVASRLSIGISSRSGTLMWEFDDIYLQSGVKQNIIDPVEVKVGKTLFVDTVYGDDTTAERENFIKPFRTAAAAEAQAVSGDTIVFRSGIHPIVSSLGKNGVTYHLESGAILQSVNVIMFNDVGVAKSFNITGNGKLRAVSTGRIVQLTAASKVNIVVDEIEYTNTNNDTAIYAKSTSEINVTCNVIYHTGRRLFLADGDSLTVPYIRVIANYVESTGNVFTTIDLGRLDALWGYAKHNGSAATTRQFAFTAGGITNLKGDIEVASTHIATGVLQAESNNGGTGAIRGYVYYEGRIVSEAASSLLDIQENGTIEINNSTLELKDNSSTVPAIEMNYLGSAGDANTTVKLNNVLLINHNQSATSDGIRIGNNSPVGYANIEMSNTRILLHSTAVGLGAKAIEAGVSSINYKAWNAPVSNGAFDGTNLIAAITPIVDAAAKSD